MSEGPTVDEVRRRKAELELQFLVALRKFEELGVRVKDVRVQYMSYTYGGGQIVSVSVVTEV